MSDSQKERRFAELEAQGSRPAEWLPAPAPSRSLRPVEEIAARLMSLHALFSWVVFAEKHVVSERIEGYLGRNNLRAWLTDEELEILSLSRAEAHEEHADSIGWKLENMWPLAWVLGFEPPPWVASTRIRPDISRSMVIDYMPGLERTIADTLAKATPRSTDEVIALEYRFHCAHNSVRRAQRGEATVPGGFLPIYLGGAVRERRHGLTWCLSPSVSWVETDLST